MCCLAIARLLASRPLYFAPNLKVEFPWPGYSPNNVGRRERWLIQRIAPWKGTPSIRSALTKPCRLYRRKRLPTFSTYPNRARLRAIASIVVRNDTIIHFPLLARVRVCRATINETWYVLCSTCACLPPTASTEVEAKMRWSRMSD